MNEAVVVFARAPERGLVKTRLAAALGEDRTLALYRAFLADTLAAARGTGARVILSHTPARGSFDEQKLADECVPQAGASFGERFDGALAEGARRGERVVLVGADSPHVGASALRAALDALRAHGAVLGPGTEGGFYLIGARGPVRVAEAFDAPNEAAAVCRLLRPALLPASFDVDVPADLVGLILHLEMLDAAGVEAAPRTREVIRAMGLRVAHAASGSRERVLVVP